MGNVLLKSAFHGARFAIDQPNVSEDHPFRFGLGAKFVELSVELGELGDELFTGSDGGEGRGNKRFGIEGSVTLGKIRKGGKGGRLE